MLFTMDWSIHSPIAAWHFGRHHVWKTLTVRSVPTVSKWLNPRKRMDLLPGKPSVFQWVSSQKLVGVGVWDSCCTCSNIKTVISLPAIPNQMSRLIFKGNSFWAKEFILLLKAKAQQEEMWRDQTQKIALGQTCSSVERAESKVSAQHKSGHHNQAGRCGLWGIHPCCKETQSAISNVPKPRKGQHTQKAALTMHSTFQTGSSDWEPVLQLLSRQQHGYS